MMILVCYDVSTDSNGGPRRLRRVAKLCEDYGQRVQYSVFECLLDPGQWASLKKRLQKEIDPKMDSLRFYYLGSGWRRKVEHIGAKPGIDQEGVLIL